MARKKTLNIYGICEAIAKRSGQPIGLVNKAIVAAGLVHLLETRRLDPQVFTEQNVKHLQQEALGMAHQYGLLERE